MHRFWGHFFDLTDTSLGTLNFDLTPLKEVTEGIFFHSSITSIASVHP